MKSKFDFRSLIFVLMILLVLLLVSSQLDSVFAYPLHSRAQVVASEKLVSEKITGDSIQMQTISDTRQIRRYLSVLSYEISDSLQIIKKFPESTEGKVLVVVNANIQPLIQSSLEQYVRDLFIEGYDAEVLSFADGTYQDLRDELIFQYENERLMGVVMIGSLPTPWFELPNPDELLDYMQCIYPIDSYFMDLNSEWCDTDNNGRLDEYSGDNLPEIWLGRLVAYDMIGNEVELLNKYFRKNHAYRISELRLNQRCLAYNEVGYIDAELVRLAYSDTTLVPKEEARSGDYRDKLSEDYEFLTLDAHSFPWLHSFQYEETGKFQGLVSFFEIILIKPLPIFYHIQGCFAARYVESNCIGNHYIFSGGNGLALIGGVNNGGIITVSRGPFYELLGQGENIGEAFKEGFIYELSQRHEIYKDFGVILGDPTLKIKNGNSLYHTIIDIEDIKAKKTETTQTIHKSNK